jgi:hypothetical protein
MKKDPKKSQNNLDDFDPKKHEEIKELTNKAIHNFLNGKLKEKAEKRTDLEALNNTVEEFLNCFIILGYTEQGEPVNIISAHNQQEADSLATLVNKFFMNCNTKDNNS